MQRAQNERKVREILMEVEPRILGREHKDFRCSCGKCDSEPAIATSVEPAGSSWYLWTVLMTPKEAGKIRWACGLSEFIPVDELEALFAKHFPEG